MITSNEKLKTFFSYLVKGCVELTFFLPVLLGSALFLLPKSKAVWWLISLLVCYCVPPLIVRKSGSMRMIYRLLIALGIGLAHGTLSWLSRGVGSDDQLALIAIPALILFGSFIAFRGLSMKLNGWDESFPNTFMLIGIASYMILQIVNVFVQGELASYYWLWTIGGILSIVFMFIVANERTVDRETAEIGKSPSYAAARRQNRWMTMLLVGIVVVAGLIRPIQELLERMFTGIVNLIINWLNRPREETEPLEPPPVQTDGGLPLIEPQEPSRFMQIVELILKILATGLVMIVLLIMLFIVGRQLYKVARKFINKLFGKLDERENAAVGFTDEVENLMTLTNLRKQMKRRFQSKKAASLSWDELRTNKERIRYLYNRYLLSSEKKGYEIQPQLTPRETIDELMERESSMKLKAELPLLVKAYEQARYGDKLPETEVVEELKRKLEIQQRLK